MPIMLDLHQVYTLLVVAKQLEPRTRYFSRYSPIRCRFDQWCQTEYSLDTPEEAAMIYIVRPYLTVTSQTTTSKVLLWSS
jgi:hypothetical protein